MTGKPESIDRLTRAVGFRYVYDAKNDQYIHTSGIMILTPEGKISRYFYGIRFPGRDLRLGLVEASANKIGSPTDQILLYCFHYDPAAGKYTASILNYVRIGGAADHGRGDWHGLVPACDESAPEENCAGTMRGGARAMMFARYRPVSRRSLDHGRAGGSAVPLPDRRLRRA